MRRSILALTLICGASPMSLAQQSESFIMDRVSIVAVGSAASSASHETVVTVGQVSLAGASSFCNRGFVNSVGFWSVLGDLPVPTQLQVDKNDADPSTVELLWTGTNETFELFRSTSPANVAQSMNLHLATSLCEASDTDTTMSGIVFYKVVPMP